MNTSMLMLVLAASDAPVLETPLSLGEVLSSTRQAYPALLALEADVDAARGDLLAASGAFDPVWRTRAWGVPVSDYPQVRVESLIEAPTPLWGTTLFGGYRIGRGKFQAYYGERETWSQGELRAGAVVPLLRNGPIDRRRATEARAVLGQSIAGLTREQQELELLRLASFRYWDWVAAGARRDIARGLLAIAKERDGQLAARARLGDVAQFDRQDNARSLVQREAFLVQAQRALDQAALELSLFVRDPQGEVVLPPESRLVPLRDPPEPPEVDFPLALSRRPDVRRLMDQKSAAQVEHRFQNNQLLPALDLGVLVTHDFGTPNSNSLSPQSATELEFNAVLEVPLLYRAPLGRIQAARANVARLDAQLRLATDRARMEMNDALSALTAARARIVLARQEVEVATQLEQGERQRFELGDTTLLFVNLREQGSAEAKLREVDALAETHKALAALRAALALQG